ncbi:hypothetical protein [Streptomyces sp. NPDC006645]|uniref:hypothetical protein n=1 Tax=unclassified Streptomyces TaxID=2593676 RepID=UPI0033A6572D
MRGTHGIEGPVDVRDRWGRPLGYEEEADGAVRISLGKGDSALITAAGDRPVPRIGPNAPAARWVCPPEPPVVGRPLTDRQQSGTPGSWAAGWSM